MWKRLNSKSAAIKSFAFFMAVVIVSAVLIISPWQNRPVHAFPSNGVLDNFNRAGTTNPPSASWSVGQGDTTMELSNDTATARCNNSSGNAFCGNYWNASSFGPDSEAYVTFSGTLAASGNEIGSLYLRQANPSNVPTWNGYELELDQGTGNSSILFFQIHNGASTQLGTTLTGSSFSAGTSFGATVTGTGATVTLEAWFKPAAGSWTSQGTRTDSGANRVTAAGFIGTEIHNPAGGNTCKVDDFGGGTIVTNATPAAPTLSSPSSGATGVSTTPQFQLRTTDADNDYLRYKIEVCTTSNCSSVLRTIDETSSQTGWSGQDQQTSTAYTGNSSIGSSTMAVHTYQSPILTPNTQYWWRGYAIDPTPGTNTFSSASSISTFTTGQVPAAPTLEAPAASSSGVSTLPMFQLRSTDAESDYLQYFIQIYDATACGGSQVGSNIDQTASQTGWQGQDQQTSTAYTGSSDIGGSKIASYQYNGTSLTPSHLYSWRAKAIDPGGSNTFGSLTSCQDFTVGSTEVRIGGGTTIQGGTIIQ